LIPFVITHERTDGGTPTIRQRQMTMKSDF
jgi:hypothetical protein